MSATGIFCMNSSCEHYFEDNCLLFYEKDTIEISKEGKCKSFKECVNEGYKLAKENENESK